MKHRLCILLFLFQITLISIAQEKEIKPGKPNELDKLYTPDKNSSTPSNGSTSSGSWAGKANFAKFNFGLLARSTCAFFYERKITDGISLQGGLGYVYGSDKAQVFLTDGESIYLNDTKSSISLGTIIYHGTFKSGGPFLSAAVRFYYSGLYSNWFYNSGDRSSYLELGMRYYGQHYSFTSFPNDNNNGQTISGGSKIGIRNTCY